MAMTHKEQSARVTKAAERVRTFCISSDSPDRDNDVIHVDGWETANYAKNPVVLWAHNYASLPVGRGSNVRVAGHRVLMDIEFADTDEGNGCLALVDAGMLNATSVGFRPLESSYDSQREGINFIRQELLEVSIVPVPANADALIVRRAAQTLGLSAATITKMFGGSADADEPVLRLADEDEDEIVLLLADEAVDPLPDAAEMAAIVRAALPDALAAALREIPVQVRAAFQAARGRID